MHSQKVPLDIGAHDLVEGFVTDVCVGRIPELVAALHTRDVDLAVGFPAVLSTQVLQTGAFSPDMAGDGEGVEAWLFQIVGDLARPPQKRNVRLRLEITPCPGLGVFLSDSFADALG